MDISSVETPSANAQNPATMQLLVCIPKLSRRLRAASVTWQQFAMLVVLYTGPKTVGQMADAIYGSAGRPITELLGTLQARDWVTRRRGERAADSRSRHPVQIGLTLKGQQLLDELFKDIYDS